MTNDKLMFVQLTSRVILFTYTIMYVRLLPPMSQDVKWI